MIKSLVSPKSYMVRSFSSFFSSIRFLVLTFTFLFAFSGKSFGQIQATGGTGKYKNNIYWLNFAGLNLGTGGNKTFTFNVNGIQITAIIENVNFTDHSGNPLNAGYNIQQYISGDWTGDRLNYLYNIGGTGKNNTLVNAIRANVGGNIAKFRIRTYATINGFPADIGLVFANAESDDSANPTASNAEYTQGTTDGTDWKLLEKGTGAAAKNTTNRNIYFSNGNKTAKLICGENTALLYTQKSLTNAANPLTINAQFLSGGLTAMALGVIAYSESSDAPDSYGAASHTLSPAITLGDNPNNSANLTRVVYLSNPVSPALQIDPGVVTKPSTPKLGVISGDFDPAVFPNLGINADADNLNGENDEDGILNFPVLQISNTSYSVTAVVGNTTGVDANLVGWIDFNRNGTFEANEGASAVVANGSTSATLNWTSLAGRLIEGQTYARFRISTSSGLTTSTPVSVISNGEVEDYTLNIIRSYDLGVTKIATPAVALGGGNLAYTITVINNGPHPVLPTDVISVVDNLPAGFTATSFVPSVAGSTYTSANGNWTGLSLTTGQSATLTISGTVSPSTLGPLNNTVTVKVPPLILDPVSSNNTSTISTPINWDIDFNVLKTVDNSCADPVNGNTYTINVSNKGTTASTLGQTVTVTDVIPAGFTVSSAAGVNWTVSNVGNSYSFSRTSALAAGASFEPITIKVVPPAGGTNWVNTANLSYTGVGETTPANNTSGVTLYAKLSPPAVTSPIIYCQDATAMALTATGNGLKWYSDAVGGVGSATAPVPVTTVAGTTTYYVTQTNGSCESDRALIIVTVQAPLSNNVITAPAVVTFCDTGVPGTITGNTPSGGSGTYTYQWQNSTTSSSDGFTNIAGATQISYAATTAINQTTYYRRIASSATGDCGPLISNVVTVTVNPVITGNTITISAASQFCTSGDPDNITGSIPTGGDNTYAYSWEQSINGGTTWTPVAGIVTANYNPAAITVTTMYRRVITSGTCSITSNAITVTIDLAPTIANAGADIQQCAQDLFQLNANVPIVGKGVWAVVSGPAVIDDVNNPVATANLPSGATATLSWTITNGTCTSSSDLVVITNYASPTIANAGIYPTQYNSGVFTLNGNVPTSGIGVWTVKAGSVATIADPTSANTNVTIAANTSATLVWTISNGLCAGSSSEVTLTNTRSAALKVVKSIVTPGPFVAGQPIVYRIIASNNGPSDAQGIKIIDDVPTEMVVSNISLSVAGNASIGQNVSSGNRIDVIADVAAGAGNTVTIDVNGTIDATYSGTLTNTATVTSPNVPDPDGPATSVVTSPVTRNPVLSLVKTGPSNIIAGDAITYQITVSNSGTSNAIGTTITDAIPAQVTNTTWTLSKTGSAVINGSTSGSGNNINFTGNIPAGSGNTIVINVSGTVSPSATGSFTNTATATPAESVPPVNSNTVTTNISSKSGLVILKNGPAAAQAGTPISYILKITNNGLSDAANAAITDAVPPEIKNVSWTSTVSGNALINSGATGTGNSIILKGNIPTGAANVISVTVTGTIDPSFSGASTNTAIATPSESGSPVSKSVVTTDVSRTPVVTMLKKGPATATAGETITYTIEATNLSIADAKALSIKDQVSAEMSNVVWTTATTGAAGIIGSGNGTGNVINITGNLPAGTGNKITITVTGNVSPSFNGTLTNTAIGTPAEPGTTPGTSTATTVVNRVPVLKILKAGPATITAGQQIIYTVEVSNTGTADALLTAITDLVPSTIKNVNWKADVEGDALVNTGAIGSGNGINVSANIPAGTANKVILTVKGTVDAAFNGNLINTAEATPSEAGTTKVSSTVSTSASRIPVLTVSKTGPANLIAGQNITYTITVNNFSVSDAKGLVITDQVPAAISDVNWVASVAGTAIVNGTASGASNTISVNADLSAGAGNSITITVTGTVSASLNSTLTNTATVTPAETGAVAQTATSTTVVSKTPILSIQKTGPTKLSAGQQINYTIAVSNAGTADAENASITDAVPAGVSAVTWSAVADPAGAASIIGTSSGVGNAISLKANIPAGVANIITVNVQGTVSPSATGVLANTATVTPAEPGTTPKSATVTTALNAQPSISLNKTGPSEVSAGQTVTYTVNATNGGPSNANNLNITDAVPALLTNVSWTASATGTATVLEGGVGTGNSVSVKGNIAAGTGNSILITIKGEVPASAAIGTLSNTAEGIPGEPDVPPVTSNTITTTIKRAVSIVATKSAPETISAGEGITYILKVTNSGPSDAQNLLITDQLPAGITNASWTTSVVGAANVVSGATGTGSTVNLRGNIPALGTNSILVQVTGTVDPGFTGSQLANTFIATPSEPGNPPVPSNEAITLVGKTADLQISKAGPASAIAGQVINYTINVNNAGPSNVTNARIVDAIPATLTNVSWTATALNGAAINSPATGTSNQIEVFASIPSGNALVTIKVSGTINPNFGGSLNNTATATPEPGVTDPTPASSTSTTTVGKVANVRIVKSGPADITAGEPILYSLRIVNDGPSNAPGVRILDVLPPEITGVSWTATATNGATVSTAGANGNVDFMADIPSGGGAAVDVIIKGTVSPSTTQAFANKATANFVPGSDVTDPDLSSNESTVSSKVNLDTELKVSKSGPSTIDIGDRIDYRIEIKNGGTSDITGATITDNVPADIAVTSWTATASNGAVIGGLLNGTISGNNNAIATTADIPAFTGGAESLIVINITGTVKTSAGASFTNTVTVEANGKKESSVVTAVNQSTDVYLEKIGSQSANAGSPVTYQLKIGNNGPIDVNGILIADQVPAAIKNVTWSASRVGNAALIGGASGSTNDIQTTANIPAGAGNYVLIDIQGFVDPAAAAGNITNRASATLPVPGVLDFNPSNNTSEVTTAVISKSGISVIKSGPAKAISGTEITYTVTAVNAGPSNATQAIITDNVSATLSNVTWTSTATGSATVIGATGTGSGNAVSVTADLPAGTNNVITITIKGTIDPAFIGSITNKATVTPSESGNTPVTSDDITTEVTNKSSLRIVKSGPSSIDAGKTLQYTLHVNNGGPGNAVNAVITDALPAGLTNIRWTADASNGADIKSATSGTTNPVIVTADIPAGAGIVTVTILGDVPANSAGGTLVNTASVQPAEPDNPNVISNVITTNIVKNVNLTLTKSAPATLNAGEEITYTLAITNTGPSDATNAKLSDPVPAGITKVTWSSVGSGGAIISSGSTGLGNNLELVANVPVNATVLVTVKGIVDASFKGIITNTAVLTPSEPGETPVDATAATEVKNQTNLIITKSGTLNAIAGQVMTYQIKVSNSGPSTATNALITDGIPAELEQVTWNAVAAGTAVITGGANGTGNALSLKATIPAGQGNEITINVSGKVSAAYGGNISNIATITPVDPDNPPITTPPVITVVAQKPVISLSKTGPATAIAGGKISYNIHVSNTGLSNAVNLLIGDEVPLQIKNVTWNAVSSGNSSINGAASGIGNLVKISGNIPTGAGNEIVIAITGTVDPSFAGTLINKASAEPSEPGNPPVTTPDVQTVVTQNPVVVLNKTGQTSVIAGAVISYVIEAGNTGLSDATNLLIKDQIDPAITGVSWTATTSGTSSIAGSANGTGNAVSITGNIPAGAGNKISIAVTGTVNPAAEGKLVNTANATPSEPGNPPIISPPVETNVTKKPVLVVTKTAQQTAIAGGAITYTIEAINRGLSDAKGVTITDAIPDRISGISWTATAAGTATVITGGTGTGNQLLVTGNIPAGSGNNKITIVIKGTVDPSFTGTLSNIATGNVPDINVPSVTPPAETEVGSTPGVVIKKNGPATAIAGAEVTYTITAGNTGLSNAKGLLITDQVPANLSKVSWTTSTTGSAAIHTGASGSGNDIAVHADIPAGVDHTVLITVKGTIAASFEGNLANTAVATPSEPNTVPVNSTNTMVVGRTPVLAIVKNGPATIAAGEAITYTILVNNTGTADAIHASITDAVPVNVSAVSWHAQAQGAAGILSGANGTGNNVNLNVTIPAGADNSILVTVEGVVNASATADLVNIATVTPSETGSTAISSTVTTKLSALPNVSLVKIGPSVISAGMPITYTVTAGNTGPSDASNLTITDAVPAGLEHVSWTTTVTGTASVLTGTTGTGNDVSVNGNIPAGAGNTIVVTITGTVPSSTAAGILLNNTAIGKPSEPGIPNVPSNPVVTSVDRKVNIRAVKSAPSVISAGEGITYTLQVFNDGPGDAVNLTIEDAVNAGIKNVNWTTNTTGTANVVENGTGNGNAVKLKVNIPAGTANGITVLITGQVDPAFTGNTITNSFIATPSEPGNPPVPSTPVITTVTKTADIQILKAGTATAVAGSAITYTLTVNNAGPSNAGLVNIVDPIPAGITGVTWTAVAQNGAVITGPASGAGNVNLNAAIPAGLASVFVSVKGTLSATYTGATLANTATATPEPGVKDPTPATSTVTTNTNRVANVRIIKSGPANIGAGEVITYELRVVNDGPSTAVGVEIKDALPSNLEPGAIWNAVASNGATVSLNNGTGNVSLTADIPSGIGEVSVKVTGKVKSDNVDGTAFTNTATANFPPGSPITDPDLSSNISSVNTVVNNDPVLKVSKSGPATVDIGDPINYTIVIRNGGAGNITDANITDPVPNDVTVSSWNVVATGGATITGATNGLTNMVVTKADIPADGNPATAITINIQGTVKTSAAATFTNTVTVEANGTRQSSVVTAVNKSTDIKVEKSGPQAITAGSAISYTIKVNNAGPVDVAGLIINDDVPLEIEKVNWTAQAFGLANITDGLTGTINGVQTKANIPVGDANYVLITINGVVKAGTANGSISNIARVQMPAGISDFNLSNNTSTVKTIVSSVSGLEISKVGPQDGVTGSAITYTIKVVNNGPSNANQALIRDVVPSGLNNVSWIATAIGTASINAGAAGSGNIVAVNANVAAGSGNEITIIVKGTIDPGFSGKLVNTATVTPSEPGNPPVMSPEVVTNVSNKSGVKLVKSGPSSVEAGTPISYKLELTNTGPGNATNIAVEDMVPAILTNVSWTAVANNGAVIRSGTSGAGNLVNLKVDLPAGNAKVIVSISAFVPSNTIVASVDNTAIARPSEAGNPPVTSNTITTAIVNKANLTFVKSGPTNANAGETITYTLTIGNSGPSDAIAVKLQDLVPSQISGVSWSSTVSAGATISTGATGNVNDVQLTANVPVNGSIQVKVTGKIDPLFTGALTNNATLSPVGKAPITSSVTTTVKNLSGLKIVKSGSGVATAGLELKYQIVVSNTGPGTAQNAVITDAIPAGLTGISWSAVSTGAATISKGQNGTGNNLSITATVPPGVGNLITIDITGKVNPSFSGKLSNIATVSPQEPGNPPVVTPPVETQVTKKTGIVISKKGPATISAGDQISYVIELSNAGPSNAANLSISDNVPAEISNVKWVASKSGDAVIISGASGAGNAVLVYADVAANGKDKITITVTGKVNSSYAGTLNNIATATPVEPGNPPVVTPPVETIVKRVPSVTIVKTGPQTLKSGEQITYVVEVTNTGLSDAQGLSVTDLVSNEIANVKWTAEAAGTAKVLTGAIGNGNNVGFSADLPAGNGNKITLTISGQVSKSFTGKLLNTARAVATEGVPEVSSNTVETVVDVADFVIPNIITPNNDGNNDTFKVKGMENYPGTQVLVFNRWGNEVYRSNDYKNDWDGSQLNEGTYYYIISRKEKSGSPTVFKGWLFIKR